MKDTKSYFKGEDDLLEPSTSVHAVVDGSIKSIGHLYAASICNFGPAPNFLAPWVYNFIVGGIDEVLKELPSKLSDSSNLEIFYNQVIFFSFSFLLIIKLF